MAYDALKILAVLVLVIVILVYMPMFLTYLSEGDVRPPSQIVPDLHNKK